MTVNFWFAATTTGAESRKDPDVVPVQLLPGIKGKL